MEAQSEFLHFINNCTALGTEHQNTWQNWKSRFTNRMAGRDPDLFWYLSSGTDFFPVSYFHDNKNEACHADAFFYSDQEPLGQNIISQINAEKFSSSEKWKNQNLDLHDAFMVSNPNVTKPIAFFLFQDTHATQKKLRPLFFLYSSNIAALTSFVYQNLKFKYLCSVADGCRALSPDDRSLCPLSIYDSYSKVLDGYWLSDHLPENMQTVFTEKKVIKGWGRYNLDEKTYVYREKENGPGEIFTT